jgi:hypothetical protein
MNDLEGACMGLHGLAYTDVWGGLRKFYMTWYMLHVTCEEVEMWKSRGRWDGIQKAVLDRWADL